MYQKAGLSAVLIIDRIYHLSAAAISTQVDGNVEARIMYQVYTWQLSSEHYSSSGQCRRVRCSRRSAVARGNKRFRGRSGCLVKWKIILVFFHLVSFSFFDEIRPARETLTIVVQPHNYRVLRLSAIPNLYISYLVIAAKSDKKYS